MKTMRFKLDGIEEFEGYITGNTWNGFECPRFEILECVRILQYIYDSMGVDNYIIDRYTIKVINHDKTTDKYGIDDKDYCMLGAYSWTWEAVEETK